MKQKRKPRKDTESLSANVVARSELMLAVTNIIQEKGWTQAEAADFLGVGQPRISDVVQGRVERFSVDMLMSWLQKLGKDVTVVVRDNVFSSADVVSLKLYVCGKASEALLSNVAGLFGGDSNRYALTVIDVLQHPQLAASEQISSTPCLVKESPLPRIVLHGDMSTASVRWQLAVSERLAIDNRKKAQDFRQAAQDNRDDELSQRERRMKERD